MPRYSNQQTRPAALAPRTYDREAYAAALDRYEEINRSLLAQGILPGYAWDQARKRLILRGEFEDVPKRFLDLSQPRDGYGNADDRAHEFGMDGDELIAWMQTAKRPVLRTFEVHAEPCYSKDVNGAARIKAFRARRKALGQCSVCGTNPARAGKATCEACNDGAKARVAAARARKVTLDAEPENGPESEII